MPPRAPLIFLALVLAALLPFVFQIARPFLTPFLLASILAILMTPAKNWLGVPLHRPALATFLTTVTTIFLLGTVLAFVGFALTQELTTAYDALSRRSLEEGGWPALVTHPTDRVVDAVAPRLPVNKEAIRAEFLVRLKA